MSHILAKWKGEWFAALADEQPGEERFLRSDILVGWAWPHVSHTEPGPYDYSRVPAGEVELFRRLCYRGVRVGFSFVDHKSQRVCARVEVDIGMPGFARDGWIQGITAKSSVVEMRKCLVQDGWRVVDRGLLTKSIPIDELQLYKE